MSTIPFTPIQGYLAMPRLRPLGHVPASFGRDWALLPPGYSLRAELKALYAAMLRTFCMSDQAIRSLCRWSPPEERRATEAPAPVFEKRFDAAAQIAAAAAAVPPIPPHVPATAGTRIRPSLECVGRRRLRTRRHGDAWMDRVRSSDAP